MSGISLRQGEHQVAQKFRKTTLPFWSLNLKGCPFKRVPSKSAAANSTLGASILSDSSMAWTSSERGLRVAQT